MLEAMPEAVAALVQWNLATGRTHQIRVHAQHIGHPLFGDPDYGGASGASLFAMSGNNVPRWARSKPGIDGAFACMPMRTDACWLGSTVMAAPAACQRLPCSISKDMPSSWQHTVAWDSLDETGLLLSSGMYHAVRDGSAWQTFRVQRMDSVQAGRVDSHSVRGVLCRRLKVKQLMEDLGRPALHAKSLGFTHPITGQRLHFESDLPPDFEVMQCCTSGTCVSAGTFDNLHKKDISVMLGFRAPLPGSACRSSWSPRPTSR